MSTNSDIHTAIGRALIAQFERSSYPLSAVRYVESHPMQTVSGALSDTLALYNYDTPPSMGETTLRAGGRVTT